MKITSEEQARELREALVEWERGGKFAEIQFTPAELASVRVYSLPVPLWEKVLLVRQQKLPDDQCASYIAWYDANVPIDKELTWEVVRDGSFVVCRCFSAYIAYTASDELNKETSYKHTVREVRHD